MSDLVERLQVIADHDWRVCHIAHTSDTAREAKARIEALEAGLDGLLEAASGYVEIDDEGQLRFANEEDAAAFEIARALLGERR